MLKKIYKFYIKILVLILLILILIQIITSYVFSFVVEKQLNLQFNKMISSSFIKVKERTYNRGVFSSEASTEIVLNNNLLSTIFKLFPNIDKKTKTAIVNNTFSIKYTTHIEHGLFIGILHGYFYPTLAYSTDTIIYPDKIKRLLSKFFINDIPLNIINIIYFDKSGKYYISSPNFNYMETVSEIKVDWKGLKSIIKYDKNFDNLNIQLGVPYLGIFAPTKGSIVLENLNYISNTSISSNKIHTGLTNLIIDKIQAEWKDNISLNLKLGDLISLITGLRSTEFLNSFDTLNPNQFEFKNIKYKTNSYDVNNYFNANADIYFKSLITNKKKYGPFILNISFEHIYSQAFSNIIETISKESFIQNGLTYKFDNEKLLKNLKQNFYPLLKEKPIIKLNKLNLTLPSGVVDIDGYVTVNDIKENDVYDIKKFMSKLEFNLNLGIPKEIFSDLFIFQMKYLLSSGNTHMDQQSSNALIKVVNILLDNQINTWNKNGYIRINNNNIISTRMSSKNGKFVISGK